ncbi:MAG: FtsW/RodA/SpoVE family cell cycle protein, partial [Calditrichia bacterium]|nr:FtsW/RodA/SpoVE family cell cycle protein [Calditrichia bacterium]
MSSFRIDRQIIIFVVLLTAIGLMMVFSVSSFSEIDNAEVAYIKFFKQISWVFAGLIVMFGISMISTEVLKKYSFNIMVIAVLLLVAVLLFGNKINGAKRWLNMGIAFIQPVEFVKIALIIYLAKWLTDNKKQLSSFKQGMAPVMVVLAVVAGLVIAQPDFSSALILIVLT